MRKFVHLFKKNLNRKFQQNFTIGSYFNSREIESKIQVLTNFKLEGELNCVDFGCKFNDTRAILKIKVVVVRTIYKETTTKCIHEKWYTT